MSHNSLSALLLLNIFLSFEVGIGGFTQDLYMHICSISVKF